MATETSGFEIDVWPSHGGKIASLRAAGREWLVPGRHWTRVPGPTTPFVDVEVSGWDEMFPTIDACLHAGLQVPDHGEAWRAEWLSEGDALTFVSTVSGCVLRRTIATDVRRVRIDYQLTGTAPTEFLWAAHPLFHAPPGTRIELPDDVRSVLDVTTGSPVVVPWTASAASIDSVSGATYRKCVLEAHQRVGWAAIVHPDGTWLRLKWPPLEVPYLALYLEREAFTKLPCIALEPMTGWFDSLAKAAANGTASSVDADHPVSWWIEADVGVGEAALHA